MDKLPFSIYDFFGYLTAGFVVLASLDYAFHDGAAMAGKPPIQLALLAVLGAYTAGQIVAHLAGGLLERGALKLRQPPEEALFRDKGSDADRFFLTKAAYRPLETATRTRVLQRARAAGFPFKPQASDASLGSKALWKHCFVRVRGDAPTASRLATFSLLADFSRNVAVAALIAASVIVVGLVAGTTDHGRGWWALASLAVAAGLWQRYLRFRRLFHAEAYIAYAELPHSSGVEAPTLPVR